MAKILIGIGLAMLIAGAADANDKKTPVDARNSPLTQGNVQLNLAVGKSTKAEVLEVFGAPNITTRDGTGREVWSYQRHATVTQSSERTSLWTVILLGGSSTTTGFSQNNRTMTLIIKFDSSDIVADFRSRTSDF